MKTRIQTFNKMRHPTRLHSLEWYLVLTMIIHQ